MKPSDNTTASEVEHTLERLLEIHREVTHTQPKEAWDRCLAAQFRSVLADCSEQSQMLQTLLDSTQDLVVIKDRDLAFLHCSDMYGRLHGEPTHEIIGKTDFDLYPHEHAEQYRQEDIQVIEAGTDITAEHLLQTAWGPRWYEAIKRPLCNSRGETIGMLCTERDITERKATEEALRNYAHSMDVLHQTMLDINTHLSMYGLLQDIVQRATELTGTQCGMLTLVQPDCKTQVVAAQYDMPVDWLGDVTSITAGVSGAVLQSGEPLVVEDYQHWEGGTTPASAHTFGRALGVPLQMEGEIIGALLVADLQKTGSFGEDEIRLVSMFAQQAAIVLHNARLYELSQQEVEERTAELADTDRALQQDIAAREQAEALLRVQRDLGIALSSTNDLQEALELCLEAILHIDGLHGGGIYLLDEDERGIRLAAHQGLPEWLLDSVRHYEAGMPPADQILGGSPIYAHSADAPPHLSEPFERAGVRALAVVPVQHKGLSVASIHVGSQTWDGIPRPSRDALEAIAAQIGGAIVRLGAEASLRRSTEALEKSEARYRAIVEDQTELICRFLPDGTLTFVNDPYCRYFRMDQDELIGYDFTSLIPKVDHDLVRQSLSSLRPDSPVSTVEHRVLKPGTEGYHWQQWTNRALYDDKGELVELQAVGRDVTDRIRIQGERDRQSRMLRALLDALQDHIIFKDTDLVYRVVNQSYCDFLGLPMEELEGKSDLDIWPEEEAREFQARERELLETGRPIHMERCLETPRGPIYRDVVKTPLRDAHGDIIGVLVVVHDITALRLAGSRLRRRNRELDAQNALAAAVSHSLDLDHMLNAALEELLKLAVVGGEGKGEVFLSDVRSQEVSLVAHRGIPDDYLDDAAERGEWLCRRVSKQGQLMILEDETYLEDEVHRSETYPHRNLCLPLKEGDRVSGCINLWLPLNGTLDQDDFSFLRTLGSQIGVAVEKAQLYEAAKKQHQRLRALSQQLAENTERERKRLAQDLHDTVGQYIAALGINLTILQRMLPDDIASKTRPRMEQSQKLIERMTECVRGVMADLHPPILDQYGLFPALEWYGGRFTERTSIEVSVEGDPLVPRLSPQVETILFRIVQEALTNVAKHAEATLAQVTVDDTNGWVRLQVCDNGVGCDVALEPNSRDERGWGLLAISEWSSAAGGWCFLDSTPGQGTRITVELRR